MHNKPPFRLIDDAFSANIQALRAFHRNTGQVTDQYDKGIMDQISHALSEALHMNVNDIEMLHKIILALKPFSKMQPVQSILLRQGALTLLASYFEALLTDLLTAYYMLYPAALPSDSLTLTLADLRGLGSIDEAEIYLINKEVDSVLRESLHAQSNYFTKRLKVDLSPLNSCLEELGEVFQRRNLFVPNSGIVNRVYLTHVSKGYIDRQSRIR